MGLQQTKENENKMKTNTLKAAATVGLTALLMGSAAAQSVSKPVGYETLDLNIGFNYIGIRLHEAEVSSGATVSAAGTTITVADGVADALTAGQTYLFEVTSGDAEGATLIVESFDAAADTLTVSDDISGDLEDGSEFTVRPSSTLETIFGAANESGLDEGFFAPGGDQVWVPGASGFTKYYYDGGLGTWANFDTGAGSPAADVDLPYTDGLIVVDSGTAESLVISGSVKLGATTFGLEGTGSFNYLSSIYPVGATLASFFGATNSAGLDAGFFAPGGDQIWAPTASGFVKYYYDGGQSSWANFDTGAVIADPAAIELPSGFIIVNDANSNNANATAPSFYADLDPANAL
jgi:hypothetical protein